VPDARRVVLARSDPDGLSDRHRRRLAGTVPDADPDPVTGAVGISGVPDRPERQRGPLPDAATLTQKG
jgi:hypothetical protein